MGRSSPRSRRAIPLAMSAALALGATTVAAAVASDLVELEVLGVIPLESESSSLLVLRQKGGRTVLPVFVGRQEALDIDLRLNQQDPERARRSDLLRRSIEALGGKVERVVIEGSHATAFHARVTLEQSGRRLDVDGRPSDSVALALASRAPIYAARALMSEAGLTGEDLARPGGGANRRQVGDGSGAPEAAPISF